MKSALFVDFDNIFLGLRYLDDSLANYFAMNPARWMRHVLTLVVPNDPQYAGDFHRRLLVRRCYINPRSFSDFRHYFTVAGFETIDCPPLTTGTKNASDIRMVIDMLDLLYQDPSPDEYLIFSGDSDFTPALRRVRRFDKRTIVLSVGRASKAYRGSCDLLLDSSWMTEALNPDEGEAGGALPTGGDPLSPDPNESSRHTESTPTLHEVAGFLNKLVEDAEEPLVASSVVGILTRHFGRGVRSLWGSEKFSAFIERARHQGAYRYDADWRVPGYLHDPSRHQVPEHVPDSRTREPWTSDGAERNVVHLVSNVADVPVFSPAAYHEAYDCLDEALRTHGQNMRQVPKVARDLSSDRVHKVRRTSMTNIYEGIFNSPLTAC